jgi:hypothetical protein
MTIVPSLQDLNQNREALLLAEVAALLHDIGKFCNLHIEAHTKGGTRQWANDHAYKAIVDDPAKQIRLSKKANTLKKPDALKNILGAGQPKAADFLDASLKDFLSNNSLTILGETYTLAELIMLGTPGFAADPNRPNLLEGKSGWLAAALGVCHNEAHVDKQDPATGEGDQTWLNVFISDAFGYEKEQVIVDNSQNSLDARLLALRPNAGRQAIVQQLCYGLGDTRRPVNEVLLSDWGWIVASLFKSALAGAVIKNQQAAIGQWKSWKDKIIDHGLHWRILRVNFDVLRLYAKAIKIADLLAYQNAVDEACQKVKNLVEEEYPLGNEIYRDTTGIYFTFPDLDLPGDLAQEIRRRVEGVEPELVPRIAVTQGDGATAQEQLKGILGKARREALQNLKQPFDAVNLSPVWQQAWDKGSNDEKKWEVCPLCGLRPKKEHEEVCAYCEQRREPRLKKWEENPAETIWLGEIADHNDRIALLVGKLGLEDWLSGDLVQTMLVKAVETNPGACVPKNPSPARLRRVWETCQRFWQETVRQNILVKHLGQRGQRKHIVPNQTNWQPGLYNGKVNGKPLDLFWQPEHGAFLTVSNLQASGALQPGDLVSLEHPENKQKAEFQIQSIREAPAPFDRYKAFLSLLTSPDQFLAFVPAADALDIVEKIRKQYETQFGKVRNRLPLFLGLVYFERKMPLMAVMDAARQMLNAPLASEPWQLKATDGNGHMEFENGIKWNVKTTMSDDKTEDLWYLYFELESAPPYHHTHRFNANRKTWVHVKNLQQGDTVRLTPSRFDFEFLDTNARRFAIHYDENGRRLRPSRPFYLEDLERLEKLWKYIERLTKTQRHQVIRTIEGTRERWYGNDNNGHSIADEVFRQFVHDTLAGAAWPKGQPWSSNPQEWQEKLVWAGVRGELSDLAELHMEILKEKGGRDGNL